jgi:DNA-binding NtrC family response regulator
MNKNIVVVDDDQLLREVVGEYLTKNGFNVETPDSAVNTLQRFEPGKYNLAVIDLVMPDMGGIELMEALLSKDPNLKIVIMTGYPTVDSAYKAMVDGVAEYIIKPFRMKELLEVVTRLLG